MMNSAAGRSMFKGPCPTFVRLPAAFFL
jgi:hypothetical protein